MLRIRTALGALVAVAIALGGIARSDSGQKSATQTAAESGFATLRGRWVRPDGCYNGSTYALTLDPARDVLAGVYYQAVVQQKFDVYFVRQKP